MSQVIDQIVARGRLVLVQAMALVALCSCTTVTVQGAQPRLRTIGALRIIPLEGQPANVVLSRGVGLVPSRDGITLGYRKETTISIASAEDCRIVIIIEKSQDLKSLKEILVDLKNSGAKPCTFDKNGESIAP